MDRNLYYSTKEFAYLLQIKKCLLTYRIGKGIIPKNDAVIIERGVAVSLWEKEKVHKYMQENPELIGYIYNKHYVSVKKERKEPKKEARKSLIRDFITGKFDREIARMAHRVALSNARKAGAVTKTVRLCGDWGW